MALPPRRVVDTVTERVVAGGPLQDGVLLDGLLLDGFMLALPRPGGDAPTGRRPPRSRPVPRRASTPHRRSRGRPLSARAGPDATPATPARSWRGSAAAPAAASTDRTGTPSAGRSG